MASSSGTRTIKLIASDNEVFEVDESVAMMAVTVRPIMDDDDCGLANGIPILNVTGPILAKVIEYCKKHADDDKPRTGSKTEDAAAEKEAEKALAEWDKEYAKIDRAEIIEVMLAANFLNIKGLLDLLCQTVADTIKNMSPEEVREFFQITNDFTPEEEAAVRSENNWAFE